MSNNSSALVASAVQATPMTHSLSREGRDGSQQMPGLSEEQVRQSLSTRNWVEHSSDELPAGVYHPQGICHYLTTDAQPEDEATTGVVFLKDVDKSTVEWRKDNHGWYLASSEVSSVGRPAKKICIIIGPKEDGELMVWTTHPEPWVPFNPAPSTETPFEELPDIGTLSPLAVVKAAN